MTIRRGMTVWLLDGNKADLVGPNNGAGWDAVVRTLTGSYRRRVTRDEISMVMTKPNVWRFV